MIKKDELDKLFDIALERRKRTRGMPDFILISTKSKWFKILEAAKKHSVEVKKPKTKKGR